MNSQNDNNITSKLITELYNPARLKIIQLLSRESQSLTDLAGHLAISAPEVSRHLSLLRDRYIVDKNGRDFILTELGGVFLDLTGPSHFVLKYFNYFSNHRLSDIPPRFVRFIDSFDQAEHVEKTGKLVSIMMEMNNNALEDVKLMVDQPFPTTDRSKKMESGSFIVPAHAKRENFRSAYENIKRLDIRSLPVIPLWMAITDNKEGLIGFSQMSGTLDFNTAFYVTDETGINFLLDLWNYFWDSGEILSFTF